MQVYFERLSLSINKRCFSSLSLFLVSLLLLNACAAKNKVPLESEKTSSTLLHINHIQLASVVNTSKTMLDSATFTSTSCQIIREELNGEVECAGQSKIDASHAVDAILEINITRYEENLGNKIASSRPAAVSLSANLIDAKTKAQIWRSAYSHQEKGLTENLLNFKSMNGKAGWSLASEIYKNGVRTIAKELSNAKLNSFLVRD